MSKTEVTSQACGTELFGKDQNPRETSRPRKGDCRQRTEA
jgi:hypothetical protein